MPIANFSEIASLVRQCIDTAQEIADEVICFSESTVFESKKYARSHMLSSMPGFANLKNFYGMKAWAAILSVDLVGSSNRAVRIGARDTYITMHAYLPVMAEIASKRGCVIGLRGDGLFAGFGITQLTGTGKEVSGYVAHAAVRDAACTGKAMIEAAEEIISPLLERAGIEGKLAVRIGIDIGPIVVTRIGIGDAQEVTAYGPPVNYACKIRGQGVVISNNANKMFTGTEAGKIRPHRVGSDWRLEFPGINMLGR